MLEMINFKRAFSCLLVFLFLIDRTFSVEKKAVKQAPNPDTVDVTKGLTDEEIEMALNDLSLADLNTLSKFVDKPQVNEYDYYDDSNDHMQPLYNIKLKENFAIDNDEYADEIQEAPANDVLKVPIHPAPPSDVLRLKRESSVKPKQHINPEYLKQLEDSFPRDQDQTNQEDFDDKKFHIRIKRKFK